MGVQINGDTGNVIATKGTYSGNVTIGGTLTYEDVTNVDSVGVITARSGIDLYGSGTTLINVENSDDGIAGITFANTGSSNWAIKNEDAHLRFQIAGNEKVRIASDGKVGINTITPRSKLHILNGGSGFDYGSISGDLIVEDSSDANIQLLSPSTQSGHIMFGDESNGVAGRIKYEHTHNSMRFYTSNIERMAIASGGNLGIGTTVANSKLDVRGSILANGSFYQEDAQTTGDDTQDKTITFNARGVFLMLISYSLGTTTTEFSRNVYSLGLFTSRSNGATWTAIQQDLTSTHVGNLTISDNSSAGQLRVQKSGGSDARQCAFRIDVLSSANVQITVTDT